MANPSKSFTSSKTQQPMVVFPADMEGQFEKLMRTKDNPISPAFDRLIAHDTSKPLGQCLAGNVYFLEANHSGRDTMGILYMKPLSKNDPLVVLDIMKKGDFVKAIKQPKVKARVKDLAAEIMTKYRQPQPKAPEGQIRVHNGFIGYQPHIGFIR